MKSCVLIYNPKSGKKFKLENYIPKIKKILLNYNYEAQVIPTKYKGNAIELIENLDYKDLVISIGGDGTFNEIVTGNLKRDKKLLISHIPLGTTNDIGAMYGYNKNIINNLKMLLNGKIKGIDVCTINNQPFVYCAGFGKFTSVSYKTKRELKAKFGYLAYIINALKEFNDKTKLYDIKYTIDDKVYNGKYSFIMISNANRIAGINNFYKDIKLDDSKFEVLFCSSSKKSDIAKGLYYMKTKDITKVPMFEFHKTDNIKIEILNSVKNSWSIDGDELKSGSVFDINIIKNVKILLPTKNIKKLFK